MAKEKVAMAVTSGKEERKGENFMRRELSHEFGRKMIAVLFAFAMTMFSVFGLGVSENEVLAATTSMVTANDKGYFVPSEAYTKEQIQTYKDNNTYPILSAATYTDSQDWLFAGWFTDAACETSIGSEIPDTGAYAKFVHADVLSVKCQIESSTESDTEHTNMRLISTLDSLMYDKVGFKVRFNNGKEHDFEVKRVFKRINAKEEYGNECGYSPKAYHDSSEYFMTYSLLDIDNKNFGKAFYVEPYWVTLDGTEVSGVSRYARVEDGYLKIVNVPVRLMTEGNINTASVTVDYTCDTDGLYELYTIEPYAGYDNGTVFGANATGSVSNDAENNSVTYTASQESAVSASGMLVNFRFQVQQELIPSESKFKVSYTGLSDGTNNIALNDTTIVFRNFPLTYSGGYDISWYEGYEKSETYAIASAADLYGLAALANGDTDYGTVDFTKKTIYVVADISVNKGSASLENGWVAESGATTYPWEPIGKPTAFQGIFDGQGNTISGIYVNIETDVNGLFGIVDSNGKVKNLRLANSYYKDPNTDTKGWRTGSIVGQLNGTVSEVYAGTDVVLECTTNVIGGLVGQCSGTANILESWFTGTVRTTNNMIGGIVGRITTDGDVTLENCLNSGSVISTYNDAKYGVAGLIGRVQSGSVDIIKSMNTGEVKAVDTSTTGAIVGEVDSGASYSMSYVYATDDCRVNTEDKTLDADAVTGYTSLARTDILDTAAYTAYLGQYIKLNLDETWVARYQDVPAIRSLVDDSELTYDTAWYKSAEATNIIRNKDELYGFMMLSTIANEQFTGETIQLGADIKVGEGYEWTPVGTSTSLKFEGSFDGKWHTISGITVNATKAGAGLFGNVGADSTIKRLTLKNSAINSSNDNIGGIAGYTEGNIEDVYVDETVSVTQTGGSMACAGGIVGQYAGSSEASIIRCWFAGTVTSDTTVGRCGGIVGRMYLGTKTLEDCLNTGTVTAETSAGGLIGSIIGSSSSSVEAAIRNCLNTGVVTSNKLKTTGCVFGDSTNYVSKITMENVYTTVEENGTSSLIGTDSINNNVQIYGMPAEIEDVLGENGYIYTEFDFDSSVNENCWVATADGLQLKKFSTADAITDLEKYQRVSVGWYYNSYVNGALADSMTYTISTSGELYGLSQISASDNFKNDTIQLGDNIVVNKGAATETGWIGENPHQWNPISKTQAFAGTFDGNGKNISGIYMKDSAAVNENGLFAWTSTSSTIKNLKLTNSYFELNNTTTGRSYIGSIAGYGCGSLENVYSDAIIVTDISYAGGLVGGFAGDAERSISKSWYAGKISGKRYVGGIAGLVKVNIKTIENCLVTGTVRSNYVYNGGGYTYFGGIVGQVYDLKKMNISNCLMNANLDVAIVEHSDPDATGSVVGRIQAETEITNVYTTGYVTVSNDSIQEIGKITGGTLTGMPIETTNVMGENAYIYAELDFYDEDKNDDGIWAVVADNGPVLKALYTGEIMKDIDRYQKITTNWYYNRFSDGVPVDGTEYVLSTSGDLYGFSQLSVSDNFKNDTVRLDADIVLNEGTATETGWVGDNPHQWAPIGKSKAFAGTFNGMDSEGVIHTISGLYMKDNSTATKNNGLFAQVENGSTIQNVKLTNSYFELSGNTSLERIGSIVGYSCGNLDTVYSDAVVVTDGKYVGGLVGYSNYYDTTYETTQEIKNCWFDGVITGDSVSYAGGIAGTVTYQSGGTKCVVSLTDCLNTGKISNKRETGDQYIGGIVGHVWGGFTINLTRCLNEGRIDLNCYDVAHSFVGRINSSSAIVTVDNCYTTEESCIDNNGKIKVWSSVATIAVSQEDVLVSESVILGEAAIDNVPGLFGEDTQWMIGTVMAKADGTVIGTPILTAFGEWWNSLQTPSALVVMDMDIADEKTGESEANAYEIENLEELYGFAVLSQTDNFAGKYIKLSDNIDVNPDEKATDWKAGTSDPTLPWKYSIGKPSDGSRFAGTFDGNGKTISGIHMAQETTYLGLFAATEQGSTVKNLRLTNSYFKQLIPYGSNGFVGSVICDCRGTVSGVYSNAIIETGNVQAGGIVSRANGYDYTQKASDSKGYATVNIDNCWFDGSIYQEGESENAGGIAAVAVQGTTNMTNCLFTGTIEGTYGMGGLCGLVMANENNTLNIASSVSAGKITNPLESGRVGAIVARVANGLSYDAESNTFEAERAALTLANVFASRECYSEVFGYADEIRSEVDEEGNIITDVNGNEVKVDAATIEGTVIRTHGKDRFIGYCTEVSGEKLNFSDTWAIRNSGVPVPKCFVDVVGQDNTTDISGLDKQLGLDTLSTGTETVTLANAVNQGMGNYVITLTDKVESDYTTYLAVLDADDGLNFTKHVDNTGGTAADGVFNAIYTKADGDWVINVTFVENKETMYISVNTAGVDSLSPYLQSDYTDTSGTDTITLSMLKNTSQAIVDDVVVYEYGNTFVIQLPNGHFIINDSGDSGGDERKDFVNLITYLQTLAGTTTNEENGEKTQNPIYVDAWTISHQHSDHMYAVRGFSHLDDFSEIADVEIYVDGFYINEPNNAVLHIENEYFYETVEKQYDSINLLRKNATSSDTPSIYRYQTGQRYYFNGVKMDVILAQEQIPYSDYPTTHNEKYNTCSVTLLFTLDSGEKIYIGGDSLEVNDAYIMAAYGENPSVLSNINVYVAPHHGKNTATNYIQYLTNDEDSKFDVVLYPCSVVYDEEVYNITHTFQSAVYANIYLNKWSLKSTGSYYTYGNGNVVLSFQNGSINVETIAVQ